MLLLHQEVVLHQVDERGIDVASVPDSVVEVEGFAVDLVTHEDVIEVPIQVRVVLLFFVEHDITWHLLELILASWLLLSCRLPSRPFWKLGRRCCVLFILFYYLFLCSFLRL